MRSREGTHRTKSEACTRSFEDHTTSMKSEESWRVTDNGDRGKPTKRQARTEEEVGPEVNGLGSRATTVHGYALLLLPSITPTTPSCYNSSTSISSISAALVHQSSFLTSTAPSIQVPFGNHQHQYYSCTQARCTVTLGNLTFLHHFYILLHYLFPLTLGCDWFITHCDVMEDSGHKEEDLGDACEQECAGMHMN